MGRTETAQGTRALDCRESMIKGYDSVRPLSDTERASIQDFGNLRNLWDIGDMMATENLTEE